MNLYPFFIECSKYYQNEPYKQKFLQTLALGKGMHILKRNNSYILITPNGEFSIPKTYSDKARHDLHNKIWKMNDFIRLAEKIEKTRKIWQTIHKKDKIYYLYKYVASLPEYSIEEKKILCSMIIFALLLKIIKAKDIIYEENKIIFIDKSLFQKETYTNLNFVYDYSNENKNELCSNLNNDMSEIDNEL